MNSSNLDKLKERYEDCDVFPVVLRAPADLITPLGAYLRIAEDSTHSFLFESVERGEALARYSFLGSNPAEMLTADQEVESSCFELLKAKMRSLKLAEVEELPDFCGGAVGFFDFASVEEFEPVLKQSGVRFGHTDQTTFMFFETVIAFDHARQEMMVISLVFKNRAKDFESFCKALEDAEKRNRDLAEKLSGPTTMPPKPSNEGAKIEITSNWDKNEFLEAVETIKEQIRSGDVYQVVLSQCFSKPTDASAVAIYRALRSLNPSPYMFLINTGESSLVGASPEMLIKCKGSRVGYRPIAGTRPRGKDIDDDKRLALEMRADKKEVAEHTMLVDLGRNDLGRVAKYGSVDVKGLMTVEKFSHVQHLVTYLSAELDPGKDRFDAFEACFPAGTVSGAPKIKAIETILKMEPTPRGVYSGAVGYIDYAGNLDTCIAIRTLQLKGGVAKVQAGAGIVADSIPLNEFRETEDKARGLFRAIELAETGVYG